jgi:hypothetical protein
VDHRGRQLIVVLIPLLGYPEQVDRVLGSLRASEGKIPLRPYCLISPNDFDNMAAVSEALCDHTVVTWEPDRGDYAKKMNLGVELTTEPWVFLGSRDLRFHPNWAHHALLVAEKSGKRVIGTNDMANPLVKRGRHSTHTLVARSYIEELGTIDEPGKVVHEGYSHNWVDNELVETAQARGEFAAARLSVVEHLHPIFSRSTPNDATYDFGQRHYREDMRLFKSRRKLWARGAMRPV